MCEKNLYKGLEKNQTEISKFGGEYYLVAEKIQMKMKLLDTKIITGGVYIDR